MNLLYFMLRLSNLFYTYFKFTKMQRFQYVFSKVAFFIVFLVTFKLKNTPT